VHEGRAVYLLFNGILGDRRPEAGNVLTSEVLAAMQASCWHGGPKVVYGEACLLGDARLVAGRHHFPAAAARRTALKFAPEFRPCPRWQLKHYQAQALEALERYLRATPPWGPAAAFLQQTGYGYNAEPFGDLPCVCLRIPTGGGKTLLAAHAIGQAGARMARPAPQAAGAVAGAQRHHPQPDPEGADHTRPPVPRGANPGVRRRRDGVRPGRAVAHLSPQDYRAARGGGGGHHPELSRGRHRPAQRLCLQRGLRAALPRFAPQQR
jgi:hypothetical protein